MKVQADDNTILNTYALNNDYLIDFINLVGIEELIEQYKLYES